MRKQRYRKSVKLMAFFISIVFAALVLEGMARLTFAYQEDLLKSQFLSSFSRGELVLDPYEIESPTIGGHWLLRPGFTFSNSLDETSRINQYGMRGPEIDKNHVKKRILALGDSVTFGLENFSYPPIIERYLNQSGLPVEVINGGVEGYAPRNLLYEVERYIKLQPEIVTIFIGWNAIYSPTYWIEKHESVFRFFWLFRNLTRKFYRQYVGESAYAEEMLKRIPHPVPDSDDVIYASGYQPLYLNQIEKLIDLLQKNRSSVFLITLPGLFVSDQKPSENALKIGHLPIFTDNPYVLAKITERFNERLRELAKRRGVGLIDLAVWSERNLFPREDYYYDSVHLSEEGLNRIGRVIAKELQPTVAKLTR